MADLVFDCDFTLAFNNITFCEQSTAQVMGLFGVSGSGKTSILHALAGIHTPKSGKIYINGQAWFDHTKKINLSLQHRRVGLVFQDAKLFPHKTVMDNLLFGYRNINPNERIFGVDDIISLLKLDHLTTRMPTKLSGGEKQRVALGRALLYSPKLLLMDEPLSALDSIHKQEILPFFQKIINTTAIPVVYISHDKAEIEQLTSKIHHL